MGEKKKPYFEIEISKNFPSGISTHQWNEEQKKSLEAAGFPQYTGGGER